MTYSISNSDIFSKCSDSKRDVPQDVATICFDAFEFATLNKMFSCRGLAIKLLRHIFYICNNE